jgi:hypothetical protein
MSCSQRTQGRRRIAAFAIAGASAGKDGDTATTTSGVPRAGIAIVWLAAKLIS